MGARAAARRGRRRAHGGLRRVLADPRLVLQSLANIENLKCLLAPVGVDVDALNRSTPARVKPLPTPLLGLIQLLPVLFRLLVVHYQRVKNHAAAQEIVLTRFYYFQLINFYVTVMAVRARSRAGFLMTNPNPNP